MVERHNRGREHPGGEEVDICPGSLAEEGIYLYQQQEEVDPYGSHRIHEGEHQEEAHIHGIHAGKAVYACPSLEEGAVGNHSDHREVAFEVESHHEAHPWADNPFGCGQSEVARSLGVLVWQGVRSR